MKQWQKYLAELLGTFTLVFAGTTAIVGTANLLAVAFAFGLALLAGLYAFGEVSGGHFNPAVSLAMFLDRRLNAKDLLGYWVSQFLGGILAALILLLATTKHEVAGAITRPVRGNGTAFVMEIVLTALFVVVILQATKSKSYGSSAFIAIPVTLLAIHLVAIPFSGSSVNPARTFGPDLIGNKWTGFWIYLLAPAAGAILGWIVHTVVVKGKTDLKDDLDYMKREVGGVAG